MDADGEDSPLLPLRSRGKDRRRFLIVVVFDFCLVALLWLICTVTKGSDWSTVFLKEIDVLDPDFLKMSLFDIVILAILRMVILVFFYAILLFGHWLPVALTTIATTGFLVIKVLFFFSKAQGSLPQYLVILSSFTGAWFELWLVPFRVLPRERRQVVAPQNNLQSVRTGSNYVTTDDEFRSAMEYSSGSDNDEPKVNGATVSKIYTRQDYIDAADRAEESARQIMNQISAWKVICSGDPEIRFSDDKRSYYIRAIVKCSPASLFRAVWDNNVLWNKQVLETKVVLHISADTDLIYSVTAPALRGYIQSRYFLDVRRSKIDLKQEIYEGAFSSVDSSILPPQSKSKLVRGWNGPNFVRISRSPDDQTRSLYEWILNNDLKGDVPRRLIERTMCSFLVGYIQNLRNFIRDNDADYP
ncbi:hypothetical protein AB6A40_002986 [Gnathostoma spinigerum]|uniref:StAR-related lipid transfer protein 3 n=1 Tax=Gnathostoma spinigerum TaxID=75299 RepID=A0ABD6EHW7_9BILA